MSRHWPRLRSPFLTNRGTLEMNTDSDGTGKITFGGKPLASVPAAQNLNKGPGTGTPCTRGRVEVTMDADGVK
ncbi:hypothetical protein SLA2020_328430 [Shorea laevis]